MEEMLFDNALFHCAFCEKAKPEDDKASCEGSEDICLDCHEISCTTIYACVLEGNFG
jgi:hypothetical protein